MYAMMHIAMHDALNAIDRSDQSYAFDKKADAGTSPDAAVRGGQPGQGSEVRSRRISVTGRPLR